MMTAVLLVLFLGIDPQCSWCHYIDCIDFTHGLCSQSNQNSPF